MEPQFSGPVTVFQERRLPEPAVPAGYAALIGAYGLEAPLPRVLCAIGTKHRTVERDGWRLFTPRHAPRPTLEGHLVFALKYEGLDLAVLRRLFLATGPEPIEAVVRETPTGGYARRLWFLYEWLLGRRLDLPDQDRGPYVPVVDPARQLAGPVVPSSRHRVGNNLPGTPAFCPMVFRTDRIAAFEGLRLRERAEAAVAAVPKDVVARAAAFLLLKDSKSSYAIEGESPPQDRLLRWGRAIGEAGQRPLDLDELTRLQRVVIGDARFVRLGLRTEDGFVGEHDRGTMAPLPDHIGARPSDLASLLEGLLAFERGAAHALHPVAAAAILAFGFVYIHPFADGNGRVHRYLIHHVLAERGFNPPGMVFPVSAAILDRVVEYRTVLGSHSSRILPLIRWEATPGGNVRVLNDTADFYRFFDATPHVEFLFQCVQRTIDEDLPREVEFLRRHDRFRSEIGSIVDMPDGLVALLFRFLRQNGGRLSKRAREGEFAALTEEEVAAVELAYRSHFGDILPPS